MRGLSKDKAARTLWCVPITRKGSLLTNFPYCFAARRRFVNLTARALSYEKSSSTFLPAADADALKKTYKKREKKELSWTIRERNIPVPNSVGTIGFP